MKGPAVLVQFLSAARGRPSSAAGVRKSSWLCPVQKIALRNARRAPLFLCMEAADATAVSLTTEEVDYCAAAAGTDS